jgi:nucleotide-binding universal stress UspA family protein
MTQANKTSNRIVVGVDLTETGDHAVLEAVRLARQLPDSELHVTYVLSSSSDVHDAHKVEVLSRELPAKIEQVRLHVTTVCAPATEAESYSVECVFHARLGDPAAALHQVAVDVDADLIVVGTHGRTGLQKMRLGSVAEELIRIARLPVLVAHPKDFSGLSKSDRVEAAQPGAEKRSSGLSDRFHLSFTPRNAHISGLL